MGICPTLSSPGKRPRKKCKRAALPLSYPRLFVTSDPYREKKGYASRERLLSLSPNGFRDVPFEDLGATEEPDEGTEC
jgi:hypothetical protein